MTVRWRLTLAYSLVLGLGLVAFGVVVHRLTARQLEVQAERRLAATLDAVTAALNRTATENGPVTIGHLANEASELGLPADMPLRLSLADGGTHELNVGPAPASFPVPGDARWRLAERSEGGAGPAGYHVVLALDTAPIQAQLDLLRRTLALSLPLIVVLASLGGYLLAGRALAPVAEIAAQARRIEASALDERLSVSRSDDEFSRLARVLNDLFERLEKAFQQERQFLADAAHELRTPVAILRSQAEVALERPRSAAEHAATIQEMRGEIERLSEMVQDLLLMAQADAAQIPIREEPLDLMEVAEQACRSVRPLARERDIRLRFEIGDEVPARGDARLLARAAINLLTNAIRYTPRGGVVLLAVEREPAGAVIRVSDTGPGIAAAEIERIFERFYRADRSGSGPAEGSGLGLAIVKTIAGLHGGSVAVESRLGEGSRFVLRLPCAPEPGQGLGSDRASAGPGIKSLGRAD